MNEIGDINWDLPIKSLKNNQQNLKLDSKMTESLCSKARTGGMCSYFLLPVSSLAADFCTICRRRYGKINPDVT